MNADAAVPKTAMPMYVAGSHFAPYASRKIAFAGMTTSASITPKASACAVSRAMTPRSGGVAHDALSANSVVARRRDTSSTITPWASSGQSTRSSSSTAWSTRRTMRRLQRGHRRGARRGHQHGELAHRGARTELDERAVAAVHSDAAFDDGVEVRLDGALLHEHLSRRVALLDGGLRDGGEHATRDAGEQLDAVQRGNALDEPERSHRRLRDVSHGDERNPRERKGQAARRPRVASTTRDAMRRRRLGRMAASTDTRSFGLDRYLPEDVRTILEERFWHAVEEKSNDIEALMARGSCDRDRFRFEASTEGTRGNKPSPLADSNRRPPPYHREQNRPQLASLGLFRGSNAAISPPE